MNPDLTKGNIDMRRLALLLAAASCSPAARPTSRPRTKPSRKRRPATPSGGRRRSTGAPSRPRSSPPRRPADWRAGRAREPAGHGPEGRRPGRHRARAGFRARPRRQRPRLRPRRLVEQRHHLPRAGQLCRPMGQWRRRGAAPGRRGPHAAGRISPAARGPADRGRWAFPTAMRRWSAMSTAGRSATIPRRAAPG